MTEPLTITLDPENELLASHEELKFILGQADKLLVESVNSGESVLSRSTVLLSVLLAILTSAIGYLASQLDSVNRSPVLLPTAVIMAIYTLLPLYNLARNIFGHNYKVAGSQPKYYFHNWYFENYPDEQLRLKKMLVAEIRSYQDRIRDNNFLNEKRWNRFEFSLIVTLTMPPVFAFWYAAIAIFYNSGSITPCLH